MMEKTWREKLELGEPVEFPKIKLQCDECGRWFEVKVTRQYLLDWPYVRNECPYCGNFHDRSWRWKRIRWDDLEWEGSGD